MAGRYVGVLLGYESAINPEPGVARPPTADEQKRALGRFAHRLGGTLTTTVTARKGVGLDRAMIDVLAADQPTGVLLLSIDALRCGLEIDVAVMTELWELTGELGFLIEDEHLVDAQAFEYYMIMAMSVNHVRARDTSPVWAAFVSGSDR